MNDLIYTLLYNIYYIILQQTQRTVLHFGQIAIFKRPVDLSSLEIKYVILVTQMCTCFCAQRYSGSSSGSVTSSGSNGNNGMGGNNGSKKIRRRVPTMAQRRAANIRERRRMFSLNESFDQLRRKVGYLKLFSI